MEQGKLLLLVPVIILASCSNGREHAPYVSDKRMADTTGTAMSDTITEGQLALASPERKIIRTADLSCKVQHVYAATTQLEHMVTAIGGVVQESNVNNNAIAKKVIRYSADSLKEVNTYSGTAMLTLRVPVAHLDSIVNAIPGMVGFVDNRTLKQSDVTYQYLNNQLQNQTTTDGHNPTKHKQALPERQYEDNQYAQRTNRMVANLQMMDDVAYATLTIALTGPEQVYVQTVVNTEQATSTPLLLQCKYALYNGWELCMDIAEGIITVWPLVLIIALIVVYRKKLRNMARMKKAIPNA